MRDTGVAPLVTVVIPLVHEWPALRSRLDELASGRERLEVRVAAATPPPDGLGTGIHAGLRVTLRTVARGRGIQQNAGAADARGAWLLFLHVDTQLPEGWLDELAALEPDPTVSAGSFRFGLASDAWQARWLERAVACRVALFDLPYGDQALFIRRIVFEAIGGFAAIPLMEDVEIVTRLRQRGRLHRSRLQVRTSAARWERDGWLTRSLRNLRLLVCYKLGADPHRLAERYDRP